MSEKSNIDCCFLSTRPHFSQNFRRCEGRQAASRWPDVTKPPGLLKSDWDQSPQFLPGCATSSGPFGLLGLVRSVRTGLFPLIDVSGPEFWQ
jgi:hypothetical protein